MENFKEEMIFFKNIKSLLSILYTVPVPTFIKYCRIYNELLKKKNAGEKKKKITYLCSRLP